MKTSLRELLAQRIAILDGAMGTNIQRHKLVEDDFRGAKFADRQKFPKDQKNNNENLSLNKPELIADIHRRFIEIGHVDIIETNTFNATLIAQSDFFAPDPPEGKRKDIDYFRNLLEEAQINEIVAEMNAVSTQLARKIADEMSTRQNRPLYVAGAVGPLPVTASISPDVNDPGFRQVDFSLLEEVYRRQVLVLLENGIDLFLVETIFDTLNAKAAISTILELREQWQRKEGVFANPNAKLAKLEKFPEISLSFTITDKAGRTLSGQTVEAFCVSMEHSQALSMGINCALGAQEMLPFAEALANVCPFYTSFYPNAGLPNPLSETGYDQTPADMQKLMAEYAQRGLLNIVGGCCGTTPEHIGAIREGVKNFEPRNLAKLKQAVY